MIKLPTDLHNLARRKLRMISAATTIETLKIPPRNSLETLKGIEKGSGASE